MPASTAKLPPLREIEFGTLDAAQEAVDNPRLLLDGFFDYREAALGVATRGTWLLLGQKGAGKSAVLEHLRLKWEHRHDRFYTLWDLRSFPVADVSELNTGQSAGAARAQASWEFLLLLRVLGSLNRDNGISCSAAFDDVIRELGRKGFLDGEWPSKVARWKTTFGFDLKFVKLGIEATASERITPLEVSAAMRRVLQEVSTDSQHLISLDGLDSFFFEKDDDWRSLTGLLHAAESVNRFLKSMDLPITICVAIRSDIFNVLPSPDLNKLKPLSVHLDWSALGISAANHLWDMTDAKARVTRPQLSGKKIVDSYLSTPVRIGPFRELPHYLLDQTRLLPRDLVSMLRFVKEEHPGSTQVTEEEARRVVKRYCREYFEGEIFDNLAGVLAPGNSKKLVSFKEALRTLDTREFEFATLRDELAGDVDVPDLKSLLKQLFDVGGIGIRNSSGRDAYTDFAYRSINGAGFTTRRKFLLHNALARAWNRPDSY